MSKLLLSLRSGPELGTIECQSCIHHGERNCLVSARGFLVGCAALVQDQCQDSGRACPYVERNLLAFPETVAR